MLLHDDDATAGGQPRRRPHTTNTNAHMVVVGARERNLVSSEREKPDVWKEWRREKASNKCIIFLATINRKTHYKKPPHTHKPNDRSKLCVGVGGS